MDTVCLVLIFEFHYFVLYFVPLYSENYFDKAKLCTVVSLLVTFFTCGGVHVTCNDKSKSEISPGAFTRIAFEKCIL